MLRSTFSDLELSPVYESEAVGFAGDNFLNLVVAFEAYETLENLVEQFRALEDRQGRDRSAPKYSGRTLDIDILTYGDMTGSQAGIQLPRPEITRHAFVLRPLADLLPAVMHPELGITYARLWGEFDGGDQRLWPIEFDWNELGRENG